MTDPYRILGIDAGADDAQIRAVYLAAIRLCPPERDAARFERVRAAYEAIANARGRAEHALFDHALPTAADVLASVATGFAPRLPPERRLLAVLGLK